MITCAPCYKQDQIQREQEARERFELDRVRRLEQDVWEALADMPAWSHADLKSPEFPNKCRSKKLRLFAEKYTPEQGSAALLGGSGLGKTTAVRAVVKRLADEGIAAGIAAAGVGPNDRVIPPALALAKSIVWTTARAIVMVRRSSELGEEPALIRRCVGARLLVIDELGSEAHDRDGDLMNIIDERYGRARPTIVTSGLTSAAFDERYGCALLRRVAERGVKIEEHAL